MKWLRMIRKKNGDFDIIEWSPGSEFQLQFSKVAAMLGALIVINGIVSAYCLMWYAVSIKKHRFQQSIAGVIGSSIWILDYTFGGVSWLVLNIFPEFYLTLTAINLIILILHVFTLIFDGLIYSLFNCKDGWLISLAVFGLIIYFLLPMFSKFVEVTINLSETSLISSL